MREVKLPSGAVLKVHAAPFSDAKALYQAVLKEVQSVKLDTNASIAAVYKDFFCAGFSSPEVEKRLLECMKRCTYNSGSGDLKIDASTFEPEKAREDYTTVCTEIAKENILPFVKSLYAAYQDALAMAENGQS